MNTASLSTIRALATLSAILLAVALIAVPGPARAGECFAHPAITLNGSATVKSGVFVRSVACMEGSEVTGSLRTGEVVSTTKYDDGWYEIKRSDGSGGWVWGDFLTVSAEPIAFEEKETVEEEEEEEIEQVQVSTDVALVARTKGYILLQVENHGEAWYVHPDEGVRYYMKDGPTAYEMMRAFGLGITDADLLKVQAGNATLLANLKGRILLQVEQHGEAYYVHPLDGSVHYMKDGAAAYTIMRELSLGITNNDLSTIAERELETVPYADPEDEVNASLSSFTPTNDNQDIQLSVNQHGNLPSGVDLVAANEYWLARINALRAERNLRQLVLDQRWVDTAAEYAGYMQEAHVYAHEREDGSSMHQWIDMKGLDFTDRYAVPDGWRSNYFTENISWAYADGSMDGLLGAMEEGLGMFLGEESWNGPHYRTIYHEDWNSVGLGVSFESLGNGTYKVYLVYHYGSLEQN